MNLLINKIKLGYIIYLRGDNNDNLECDICETENNLVASIYKFKKKYNIGLIKYSY